MRRLPAFLAILLDSIAPAIAQDQAALQLRQQYDNCVYASAGASLRASPGVDVNSATEAAFLACQTEENAMILFLQVSGGRPQQIATGITAIKLQIKRTMRDIVANPAKYVSPKR